MAFEKKWRQVSAVPLTSNGKENGEVTVADACQFKVGQLVVLSSTSQPDLRVKVKRIPSPTIIVFGPTRAKKGEQNINTRTDVSAYLIADVATIRAEEQSRPSIPQLDMMQAAFEEEPTVAWRTHLIDRCGDSFSKDNPLPVDAQLSVGNLNVNIDLPNSEGLQVLNIPTKETEVSFTFPNGTQFYKIKARDAKDVIKVGLTAGATAAGHIPAPNGSKPFVEGLNMKIIGEHYHIDGRSSKYIKADTTYYSHQWEVIEKHAAGHEHEYCLAIGFYKA
jgi:hypothetical protein